MKFLSTLRALGVLIFLTWASFAQATCAPLGSLAPLGTPLATFETFEVGGAFERCYSFELTTPGDVGPFTVGQSGGQLIVTAAPWSAGPVTTSIANLVVEGPIGVAVPDPELAVNLGNIPSGAYEVYLSGTSGGGGSGFGLILAALPLAAVPEPDTWTTLGAGLGMGGFILLRQRRRT